jgi:ABC-type nitrate/sulfonate/bicarbonate transport system substrate-binding protein
LLNRRPRCLKSTLVGAVATFVVAAIALPCAAAAPRSTSSSVLSPHSKECSANRSAGIIDYASPFGYDASAGIIDVYAAIKLHYFSELCLTVDFIDVPVTESAYTLVSADTAQISSEGSAADTLVAEASGANMVGVATYGDTSDYALLTRPAVTKLTELEGHLLAYHTVLPVVLTEMLVKAGVDLKRIETVNDTSYNPALLIQGKFDALQAYQSNEPFTLRADGDKFRMWTPAQFGVPGTFNVVVVNRKFLAQHPTAVSDFLRAEFHAFYYCADHVATCVGFLAKAQGPTFSISHGEQEWRYEAHLALDHRLPGKGIGVESIPEWQPEAVAVLRYKRVSSAPDLAHAENTTIAAALYHGTSLIWP